MVKISAWLGRRLAGVVAGAVVMLLALAGPASAHVTADPPTVYPRSSAGTWGVGLGIAGIVLGSIGIVVGLLNRRIAGTG